jgi:hypothetical protein
VRNIAPVLILPAVTPLLAQAILDRMLERGRTIRLDGQLALIRLRRSA